MSLVNQVLNELEKRGEMAPPGMSAIRAIPPRKRRSLWPYAAAVVVLLAGSVTVWLAGREQAQVVPVPVIEPKEQAEYQLVPGLAAASSVEEGREVVAENTVASAVPAQAMQTSGNVEPAPPEKKQEAEIPVVQIRKTPAKPAPAGKPGTASAARNQAISPLKHITPRQQAEIEASRAAQDAQQGRSAEAIAGYESALKLDPLYHEARRMLAGVLLSEQRNADAERLLQEGLQLDAHETPFAMLLARLQVERGEVEPALSTLEQTLPYADHQPDYHAFYAALLQRQNRHVEAINHFQIALQGVPVNGIWWMGAGISMQALQHKEDARAAFRQALASNGLSPQLQEFVQQKLAELGSN